MIAHHSVDMHGSTLVFLVISDTQQTVYIWYSRAFTDQQTYGDALRLLRGKQWTEGQTHGITHCIAVRST